MGEAEMNERTSQRLLPSYIIVEVIGLFHKALVRYQYRYYGARVRCKGRRDSSSRRYTQRCGPGTISTLGHTKIATGECQSYAGSTAATSLLRASIWSLHSRSDQPMPIPFAKTGNDYLGTSRSGLICKNGRRDAGLVSLCIWASYHPLPPQFHVTMTIFHLICAMSEKLFNFSIVWATQISSNYPL